MSCRPVIRCLSILPVLIVLTLSGCAGLNKPYGGKSRFVIGDIVLPADRIEAAPLQLPLTVREFDISPVFDTAAFISRTGPFGFRTDYYNEFMVSPALMMTAIFENALLSTRIFVSNAFGAPSADGYRLAGRIIRLYMDHRNPPAPESVLEMHLTLIRTEAGKSRVLVDRTYACRYPADSSSPGSYAAALSRAAAQVFTEFHTDIKRALIP